MRHWTSKPCELLVKASLSIDPFPRDDIRTAQNPKKMEQVIKLESLISEAIHYCNSILMKDVKND